MQFSFKALDSAGFTRKGVLEAASQTEALQALFERGFRPIELGEHRGRTERTSHSSRKLRHAEVIAFIRELATLLSSGVGLADAFSTLTDTTKHPGLRSAFTSIASSINSGDGFAAALRKSPLVLPEYVHALARAGEATGDLANALGRSADQLEFEERLRNEAKEALTYPTILVITGIVAIAFIFAFVVPRFASILRGRDVDLPALSEWILSTGLFVNTHWGTIMIALSLAAAGIVLGRSNKTLSNLALRTAARLPVLSGWIAGAETARWTSILAVLIRSKVTILLAIELASSAVRLKENADRLRSVADEVRLGKRLSQAIDERKLLEGSGLTMLAVGEKSGELGTMLAYIATYTTERYRLTQRRLVALIEPVSILVIGTTLGTIMVGIVLAMTSLTEIKL